VKNGVNDSIVGKEYFLSGLPLPAASLWHADRNYRAPRAIDHALQAKTTAEKWRTRRRMTQALQTEVAVVGAGPAGLAAALALAACGAQVAVAAPAYDPAHTGADGRTTALMRSSVELLKNLGVWQRCNHAAAPIRGVRIVDDRGGLLRAPEVLFRAEELGLTDFGANMPNSELNAALFAAARQTPGLNWLPTSAVLKVAPAEGCVTLEVSEGGSLTAMLVVAADGRNSLARKAAGIETSSWTYGQAALVANVRHKRSHGAVATELHRRAGPLTTVPLSGEASSLVWVEACAESARLAGLDEPQFRVELGLRLRGLLGALGDIGPRTSYPLSGLAAAHMGQNRIALVGESAHVIPPIGAQGLNLGLRDAAALAECVASARASSHDIGGPETLAAYHAARAGDVLARTLGVDILNRSLLTDFLPAQALRGIGLHLLANVAPLRRLAMRGGLAPAGPLPRLMQPGALP
jgi:2-octaprenyl-6-methoxyphenol hydroxylase